MSVTTEPPPPREADGPTDCGQCGAPLGRDQEWCLECGAARTVIHRPPDWRIPLAVGGAVVAAALVAFAIAMINLSNQSDRAASALTAARSAPAAQRRTSKATSRALASWPVGLPGWTVIVSSSPHEAVARATAVGAAAAGLRVGLLDSSQHSGMAPGHWIVFSGRFPTRGEARVRAEQLSAQGYTEVRVRLVGRPGG